MWVWDDRLRNHGWWVGYSRKLDTVIISLEIKSIACLNHIPFISKQPTMHVYGKPVCYFLFFIFFGEKS